MSRTLLVELLRRHPELDEREARSRIMRGDVTVGPSVVTKPGARVGADDAITLRVAKRFVSRGGEKLDAALGRLGLDVAGKVLLDAGASTGGFTDCLLARGAAAVYSVDVGRNQLSWSLRNDPRVRVLEGTNAGSLAPEMLPVRPNAAVCDLSFRSIRQVASHLVRLTSEEWLLTLVKPQFEWREPTEGFRGVVRSPADLVSILLGLQEDLAVEGLEVRAAVPSGLPGRRGNREFFFLLGWRGRGAAVRVPEDLEAAVLEGLPR